MTRRTGFMERELPPWLSGLLIFGALATVIYHEIKRPLRQMRHDKVRRNTRNAAMALMTAATVSFAEKPVTAPLSRAVERHGWGLIKATRLPAWADLILSVVLLDYTLYIWHYLTHKVPFLWRFHLAHHVDLDLDASTALRFHAGEILLSVPWRAGQVLLLGISPLGLSIWQTTTLIEIMFHHSNIRLPARLERFLSRLIVTPRMHGIHHSIIRNETDSNWGTIFSWPDYLHGTVRLNVPQRKVTIGVPDFRDPHDLTLAKVVQLPFTTRRLGWSMPQPAETRDQPFPHPRTFLAE